MRFLVQRVKKASVTAEDTIVGKIEKGYLVFVGVSPTDTMAIADKMVKKLVGLRIFEDEDGKTNLDMRAVNAQMLVISQFTLYADCRKGNRPSFTDAAAPAAAEELYQYILQKCRQEIAIVEEGVFGADMKVDLINDGPFTIIMDSDTLFSPRG
ncbi:MAG: D-tyrosyl-tRNA(Tyr) deacylase [Acetatifactor sp.]|nr:D-tyrosyl-tRNA(Tyr) deacylase [Acetatifactor sp.]